MAKKGKDKSFNGLGRKLIFLIAGIVLSVIVATLTVSDSTPGESKSVTQPAASGKISPKKPAKLPRLVDLGAGKCIPCKMMAPILEELRAEYKGKLQVEFIDVWKDPDAGEHYGIRLIPTQIFYDGEGREIYRHEGFMSKEDILAQWEKLGVALRKK